MTEAAHLLGLVPLGWLAVLAYRLERRDAGWWWLAAAYGVSFVADTAAHYVGPTVPGKVYPLAQAALAVFALTDRDSASHVLGLFMVVALVSIAIGTSTPFDVFLRTVAWGTVAGLVLRIQEPVLGLALWCSFAVGLALWYLFVVHPSWDTWVAYQLTRLVGTALFCWAAWRAPVAGTTDGTTEATRTA